MTWRSRSLLVLSIAFLLLLPPDGAWARSSGSPQPSAREAPAARAARGEAAEGGELMGAIDAPVH